MKRKRLIGPLIGIAAGTLVIIVLVALVEIVMRLAGVRPAGGLVFEATHCYVGWGRDVEVREVHRAGRLREDLFTDDRGFRVTARGARAATGARCRVLVTGDSFTEGVWVPAEAAYPAVTRGELQARGLSVDVFNGGMRGHTISDARFEILSRWSDVLPDVVIVEHTANDLEDLIRLMRGSCDVGGGPPFPAVRRDLPAWLEGLSTIGWLRRHGQRLSFGIPAPRRRLDPIVSTPPECDRAAAEYQRESIELARHTRDAGGTLVFAFVEGFFCPTREPAHWDSQAFTQQFEQAVIANGARVLHLEDALTAPGAHLHPDDGHPSAAGHRSIGTRIADDLVASGLLASCRPR